MGNKYNIVKQIGQGGQAKVYLVQNITTMNVMAMKEYCVSDYNSDMNIKETADKEIRVLREVQGKGIPYLIDYIEDEKTIRIVMEYVQGRTLREYMNDKHIFSQKETITIGIEILDILCRFHQKMPAWIYGDLKPENIMITEEKEIYLIDFGGAIFSKEKEQKVYGTKGYMLNEDDYFSPHRDIYALGIIFYEMLTGKSFQSLKDEDTTALDFVDHDFLYALQKMLNINEVIDAVACKELLMGCLSKKELNKRRNHLLFHKKREKDYLILNKQKFVCCHLIKNHILLLLFFIMFFECISVIVAAEKSNQSPETFEKAEASQITKTEYYEPLKIYGREQKIQNKNNEYIHSYQTMKNPNMP